MQINKFSLRHNVPSLNYRLHVVACSYEELQKIIMDEFELEVDCEHNCGGFFVDQHFLWLNTDTICDDYADLISIIDHECTHFGFGVVAHIAGQYPDEVVGEELVCYTSSDLLREIIRNLEV